jgi:hypothetical protein
MPEADSAPILADPIRRYRRMIPPESGQNPKPVDCLLKAPRPRHCSRITEQSNGHWAKRATYHTFQRSFAIHPLEGDYDILTVKELLGQKHVKTTGARTYVLKREPVGVKIVAEGHYA